MTIIIFIIILAVLVLVHECGHFIVAKLFGIRVDEFGLGFPPKIASKKIGETLYTLNAIPFGGFVKIFGEDSLDEDQTQKMNKLERKRSFISKPKPIQSLVLIAGISFNIIFAWLLISLGFMIGLPSPTGTSMFGQVQNPQVVITNVLSKSPAEKAGLQTGDIIVFAQVSGSAVKNVTAESISDAIKNSVSGNIILVYHHGSDVPKTAIITPETTSLQNYRLIGISMDTLGTLKLPFFEALIEGVHSTYLLTVSTVVGLGQFLYHIIIFKSDFSQVSGPIGIVSVVGQATHLGFVYLISLVALISINLAVINLVPFPALDGGRLLFVVIEAVIKRPIKPSVVKWTNTVGFALLIILMVVVSVHDIFRLL